LSIKQPTKAASASDLAADGILLLIERS